MIVRKNPNPYRRRREPTVQVQVTMPIGLVSRLDEEAENCEISRNRLVRELLGEALDNLERSRQAGQAEAKSVLNKQEPESEPESEREFHRWPGDGLG